MKAMGGCGFGAMVVSMAGFVLFGCMAPDESEMDYDAEDIAEVRQAFGEHACKTVTPDVVDTEILSAGEDGPFHISGSGYGSASCTDAYVVEYAPSSVPVDVEVRAGWANPGNETQLECESGHSKFQVVRYASGVWSFVGESRHSGTWDSGNSVCLWAPDVGYPWALVVDYGATKYRVIAQSYKTVCMIGGCVPYYQPVQVLASGQL